MGTRARTFLLMAGAVTSTVLFACGLGLLLTNASRAVVMLGLAGINMYFLRETMTCFTSESFQTKRQVMYVTEETICLQALVSGEIIAGLALALVKTPSALVALGFVYFIQIAIWSWRIGELSLPCVSPWYLVTGHKVYWIKSDGIWTLVVTKRELKLFDKVVFIEILPCLWLVEEEEDEESC